MSHTAEEDLLIVYETEAEQWATYLRSVFAGHVREGGIRCYDIATVSSSGRTRDQEDFLGLARYKCKLLILSRGMLEGLCRGQLRRFFLARVLTPAARAVVLLCGVESLAPLLELVPLAGGECLQISSEQDAHDYLSAVTDIVKRGNANSLPSRPAGTHAKQEQQSCAGDTTVGSMVVIPDRIRCGVSAEVFVLLKDTEASADAEVQFSHDRQSVRVKPVHWNEQTLCVNAPDFPSGDVSVSLYCGGVEVRKALLQYYTVMTEVAHLLTTVADPVVFMCQALQVSCVEKLDQKLASILLERMPSGGFQGLQSDSDTTPQRELHLEDVPSLLHFAAQRGLRNVSSLLLQCPGAQRALCTADRHGQTPVEIAQSHGHAQLHTLLKETLNMSYSGEEDPGDASVYELMGCTVGNPLPTSSSSGAQGEEEEREEGEACDRAAAEEGEEEEEEDLYAPLGVNDEEEYDTILTSNSATLIANRPPAPTPRPEATTVAAAARTPFIAQVFQKKLSHAEAETLYSLPTKQAPRKRGHSISTTLYDSMVPMSNTQTHAGLGELIELQERVKRGTLTMDQALKSFSDWQRGHKDTDAIQQEKLRQLRAGITNNREDDGVYDKIDIIHHTPNVMGNDCRRGTHPVESGFYSKPLKGQSANLFWKADKR